MGTVTQQTKTNTIQTLLKKHNTQKRQQLHISYKQIKNTGITWTDIIRYQNWNMLRSLKIEQCGVNAGNVRCVSYLLWLNLESLDLRRNKLGCKGIQELLRNQWPKLQNLDIRENNIEDSGMEILIKRSLKLKQLIINANRISYKGLTSMPQYSSAWLLNLNLCYNKIGMKGIQFLVKANIPNLKNLNLDHCYICNQGVRYLIKSIWPQLKEINLRDNDIKLEGYLSLTKSDWRQLSILQVSKFDAVEMLFLANTGWVKNFTADWDNMYKRWEKDIIKLQQIIFMQN